MTTDEVLALMAKHNQEAGKKLADAWLDNKVDVKVYHDMIGLLVSVQHGIEILKRRQSDIRNHS